MAKIVDINKYKKIREKKTMTEINALTQKLEGDFTLKHNNYTLQEIDNIAYDILRIFGFDSKDIPTPIIKIAKKFGFKTGEKTLNNKLSGDIYINGDTKKIFGSDKVILVNKNEHFFHQRFVIAHELAHYLFDFLGNPEYINNNNQFTDTYYRNNHDRPEEVIANRFAASILMPKKLFVKQYYIALDVGLKDCFVIDFLSRFFETSPDSIEKRIKEVRG